MVATDGLHEGERAFSEWTIVSVHPEMKTRARQCPIQKCVIFILSKAARNCPGIWAEDSRLKEFKHLTTLESNRTSLTFGYLRREISPA